MVGAANIIGFGPYSQLNSVIDIVKTEPLKPLTLVAEGPETDDS
jgi:hypothetical protein